MYLFLIIEEELPLLLLRKRLRMRVAISSVNTGNNCTNNAIKG